MRRHIYWNRREFASQVIKEPNLTLLYDQVKDVFPRSNFVYVVRSPLTNIRSLLSRLGIRGDLEVTGEQVAAGLPRLWAPLFREPLVGCPSDHYISLVARLWTLFAEVYTQNKEEMLIMRYEDFINNKKFSVYQLAKKLHYVPEYGITDECNRQFQPKGSNDLPMKYFGPNNYSIIVDLCAESACRCGYNLSI